MLIILLETFLLSAGTYLAEKLKFIRSGVLRTGIFFGLFGILMDFVRYPVPGTDYMIGLRDVPSIIASFFFSPEAGLIAAVFPVLERLIVPLFESGSPEWSSAIATAVVALYASGTAKWVFEENRPPPFPAAAAAYFGEIVHLLITVAAGNLNSDTAGMLEKLHNSYPMIPLCAALAIGLSGIICKSWSGWKKNHFATLIFGYVIFGVGFYVTAAFVENNAYTMTRLAVSDGVKKLKVQFDDQIGYMLHCNAVSLRDQLVEETDFSLEKMKDYASDYDVDEINIFSKDGTLLATNLAVVQEYNRNRHALGQLTEFLELTKGIRKFIKQEFRPSRSDPDTYVKYIGVPFPDMERFLQLGYTANRLEEEFSTFFFPMFNKAVIETQGFFVIADCNGRITAPVAGHPLAEGMTVHEIGMTEDEWENPQSTFFEAKFFKSFGQCFRCQDVGEWRIYAFLPYTEFFNVAVIMLGIVGVVLFLICVAFRLLMIRTARAQKKVDDLLAADLALASTIQNSELPEEQYENAAVSVTASMKPAKTVGGDFYDYYELPDGRFSVTVADVSGKGVPAAIFMMKAKNMLRTRIGLGTDLASGMNETNAKLNRNNDAAMFVTAWLGIFDPKSGVVEYVSAGHNPPLILRKDGCVEWVKTDLRQRPLAAFRKTVYQKELLHLEPGDRLYLYTDGVTEAMNPKGELFGNERLEAALADCAESPVSRVAGKLEEFIKDAPIADDITMLTMEIKK